MRAGTYNFDCGIWWFCCHSSFPKACIKCNYNSFLCFNTRPDSERLPPLNNANADKNSFCLQPVGLTVDQYIQEESKQLKHCKSVLEFLNTHCSEQCEMTSQAGFLILARSEPKLLCKVSLSRWEGGRPCSTTICIGCFNTLGALLGRCWPGSDSDSHKAWSGIRTGDQKAGQGCGWS